jgi:hypothetical protein
LGGPSPQADCLQRVAAVLADDAHLVLELFLPPAYSPSSGLVEVSSMAVDRLVLRAYRQSAQANVFEGQHVEITEAGIRLRPWILSTAAPSELDAMAEAAGLALVERWAGWDRTPLSPMSNTHVSVYEKH